MKSSNPSSSSQDLCILCSAVASHGSTYESVAIASVLSCFSLVLVDMFRWWFARNFQSLKGVCDSVQEGWRVLKKKRTRLSDVTNRECKKKKRRTKEEEVEEKESIHPI